MTDKYHAHLMGKEPITGTQFNDRSFLNSAFWEEAGNAEFDRHKCCRSVNSLPAEDIAKLQKLVGAKAEQSLERVDFVLLESNLRLEVDLGEQRKLKITGPLNDPKDSWEPLITYNAHLHIIEQLCVEGKLWIAVQPENTRSTVWRSHRDAEKMLWPKSPAKGVTAEDIKIVLGKRTAEYRPNQKCSAYLLVYDEIGVSIPKRTNQWTINPKNPFVTVLGDEEAFNYNHARDSSTPVGIANAAFIELLKNDPKKAQALWDHTLEDLHTYLKQDEDESYWDLSMFRDEFAADLKLLLQPSLGNEKLASKLLGNIEQHVQGTVACVSPTLHDLLKNGAQLHLKQLSIGKGHLKLTATVEHPTMVVLVDIDGEKVITQENPRRRR